MALQQVPIPVSFSQGIDTKTDDKQVVLGKLLQLENATLVSPKQLKKAPGYQALPATILGDLTSEIAVGEGLMSLNGELTLASANRLYSFVAAGNSWADKGSLLSVNVESFQVNRSPANDTSPDSALHPSGLAMYAWEQSGSVFYSIVDTGTEQLVANQVQVPMVGGSRVASRPRCTALGAFLVLTWIDATNAVLTALRVPISNPQHAAPAITLATDVKAAAPEYDVCTNITSPPQPGYPPCDTIYYAYNASTASKLGVGTLSSLFVASPELVAASGDASGGVSITPCLDTAFAQYSITYGSASDVRNMVLDGTFNVVFADAQLDATGGSWNVGSTYGILNGVLTVTAYYTLKGSPAWKSVVRQNTRGPTGTVGTSSLFVGALYVAGKPFIYGGVNYVLCGYASGNGGIQNTLFLVNAGGAPIAKVLANGAGGFPAESMVPAVNVVAPGVVQVAALIQDLLVSSVSVAQQNLTVTPGASPEAKTSLFSNAGVQSVQVNFFDKGVSYGRAVLADTLHVTGGFLSMYDSGQVVEHGFHLWPEQLAVTLSAGADTVSYGYIGVFEWTDARGNKHQSAPSQATIVAGTFGAISGGNPSTVVFPTLRVTQKTGVVLAVYRTENNGTQYFRATDVNVPTLNNPAVATVSITDTVTDAALLAGANLYTFGGVVENVAPPACQAITTGSNRLWVLSSEHRKQVWFSKQAVPGTPAAFSDLFVLNMDPRGGDVVAIANMDAYQVFFQETNIFAVNGSGPDDTGQQDTFSDPTLIATDSGCTDPRSVVLTPMGLMYKSAKGIYLLSRGLEAQYIGADVEAYNATGVVSANLVANVNQVRFNLADGTQLVYDYYMQQWSTRPLFGLTDAAIRESQYFYLEQEGRVLAEDPKSYAIAGKGYSLRMQTSWLTLAGVSGLQRVYGMMILGSFKSPHTLRVSVAYDFNPTPSQVLDIDAEQFDPGFWGDGTTWGSDEVWGGFFPSYQFRVNFDIQKCTAIQITIEDNQVGVLDVDGNPAQPGEGYSLSNLTFIAGVKQGWRKVEAGRVFGGTGAPITP